MRRSVLLVDDEPMIVAGLQRLLRPHREKWDVKTATSATEALELLETNAFDVIVSDMRMPIMDGAQFLAITKEKYPATMRLVLSGQTDESAALRVIMVAHQFLSKPTSTQELLASLDRVTMMCETLDPEAQAAIGGLAGLPGIPAARRELSELLQRGASSVAKVSGIATTEPALAAKLLQIVNSGFFGPKQSISNVIDAVAALGSEQVGRIAAASDIPQSSASKYFDATAFQNHCLSVAHLAKRLAGPGTLGETAFTAGLLHDVGKLAMAYTMPAVYDAIAARAAEENIPFEDAERALGLAGHAKVGACLLNLWGVPTEVVETVLRHCEAPNRAANVMDARDAVYVAHRLVLEPADAFESEDDRDYISRLGIEDRIRIAG